MDGNGGLEVLQSAAGNERGDLYIIYLFGGYLSAKMDKEGVVVQASIDRRCRSRFHMSDMSYRSRNPRRHPAVLRHS